MKLTEITYDDAIPVDGYGPGFFRIGGEVFEGPTLVHPNGAGPWGGYEDLQALVALKESIDVVFVGTGKDIAHPPAAFKQALEAAGFGVEPMSSPSACRTYNVLVSEGRRIALALIPV
ncbi:Mth938-like domain-containing protein [Nereida sp. MMG025]|uniref:Mth938-like domain-containing protein n=1 Tax=Nereida sp. MMG025 TaxID=2909981 RepID=UPI001F28075E|nr:Mth938-like domain-containing protein [Nereida sp. MMG025]MCF6445428.1 Mth938-like domain-containing protein [Nereida sp. MMG025]